MTESAPNLAPKPDQPKPDWARTTLWIAVVGIITLNGVILLRSCLKLPGETIDKTTKMIESAGRSLAKVASSFKQGRVTTEFISYATSITNQQHLQFATLKQTEMFTRSEETTTGFGYIALPEVVVEARAPVEYTYYLDLNARWDLVMKDDVIYVFAPAIHNNKPAVDASAITYEVKKGRFKTAEVQENLKRSITVLVNAKARDNVELVRENGRRQTADFVERWLARSFTDGKSYPVKVYFPDEKPPPGVRPGNEPLP